MNRIDSSWQRLQWQRRMLLTDSRGCLDSVQYDQIGFPRAVIRTGETGGNTLLGSQMPIDGTMSRPGWCFRLVWQAGHWMSSRVCQLTFDKKLTGSMSQHSEECWPSSIRGWCRFRHDRQRELSSKALCRAKGRTWGTSPDKCDQWAK